MKKKYIVPVIEAYEVRLTSQLLTDSYNGVTVDPSQEVNTNFVKEDASPSYNVWDDDWRN